MLVALVSQISVIRIGVREVSGRRVVHDGLADLADGGDHSVDEEEYEEEAQSAGILTADRPGINVRPAGSSGPGRFRPYRPEHDGVPGGTLEGPLSAASPSNPFTPSLARSLLNERLPHVAAK